MASTASFTILSTLLLLAILLPIDASEYRNEKPKHNKEYKQPKENHQGLREYIPDVMDFGYDNSYMPKHLYKPGKSLTKYTKDYSYGSYSDNYDNNSEQYLFMKGQNDAREAVGLPPFTWDDTLAAFAQSWANQRLYDCALEHSGSADYGENIFWGSVGEDWSPKVAVDSWVEEGQWYDVNSDTCADGYDCGHYTQIVWKDSTKIGCAKVKCYGDTGYFMTCNYDPPGNYVGTKPY